MRARTWRFAVLSLLFCGALNQCLVIEPVNQRRGVAIRGYDAVAYFKEGKAVAGSKRHRYRWMNADWYFSSRENLDLFAADPAKYTPQYGGYCAYAATNGRIFDADPAYWKIIDGKLYFNYDEDAQKAWEEDIAGNIAKADRVWPSTIQP